MRHLLQALKVEEPKYWATFLELLSALSLPIQSSVFAPYCAFSVKFGSISGIVSGYLKNVQLKGTFFINYSLKCSEPACKQ
jgi:hypothetical protein